MNIEIKKDTLMVYLNTEELADLGGERGMLYKVFEKAREYALLQRAEGKQVVGAQREPVVFYTRGDGSVHVLRILIANWQLFKDVQATSVWENEVKGAIINLGVSGEADKLVTLHTQ